MAEASAFNLSTGEQAQRKLLVTYVNTGTTIAPVWEKLGIGTPDSAIEFNNDITTTTDITGVTTTRVNKVEASQSLDITVTGGSPFLVKLYNNYKYMEWSKLSLFEILIVRAYVGATGLLEAEKQTGCTITLESEGGEGYVDETITINLSNNKTHGTVDTIVNGATTTFTPAV